ncbi:MAG: restriction endonuclease [Nitrososphaerota archaeon]
MSYRKGRRFEYRVRDLFRRRGWIVIRAAASKPVDLVCLKKGVAILVECKNRKHVSRGEVAPLIELADKSMSRPVIALNNKGKILLTDLKSYKPFKP